MLADGRFVLSWLVPDVGAVAQVFNADGTLSGPQIAIASPSGIPPAPVIGVLAYGRLVFTWPSGDVSTLDIFAHL